MVWEVWFRKLRYRDKMTLDFSCFFSSFLLFFRSRLSSNGIGMACYHLPMEVEFPRVSDLANGFFGLYRWVVGLIPLYDCTPRMIVSFDVSLSFSSLLSRLWPGTNGIGTGFHNLPLKVEVPCMLDWPKGYMWCQSEAGLLSMYRHVGGIIV